ncbi:hypothetical protein VTK73DRAFT_6315 [Phialemonium thermophilum]|uniref:Uncharacterized protein n=1 Tax=Phialemonium thermophilum TaxID=223376 RepID=A0ABR3UZX5_9PEZI
MQRSSSAPRWQKTSVPPLVTARRRPSRGGPAPARTGPAPSAASGGPPGTSATMSSVRAAPRRGSSSRPCRDSYASGGA